MLSGHPARGPTSLAPFLLVLLVLVALVASYPDPGACSGDCWTHDPSVVKRADGTYFRFSTGGGIGIYSADSLAGSWTYDGEALPDGSSVDLTGNTDLWVSMPAYLVKDSGEGCGGCNWLTLCTHRLPWWCLLIVRIICTMPSARLGPRARLSGTRRRRRWSMVLGRIMALRASHRTRARLVSCFNEDIPFVIVPGLFTLMLFFFLPFVSFFPREILYREEHRLPFSRREEEDEKAAAECSLHLAGD